jgi:hypothetical protein
MSKNLVQMPFIFAAFDALIKAKYPNAQTLNKQELDKDRANIYEARTASNNIAIQLKWVKKKFCYAVGGKLSSQNLETIQEEIANKGLRVLDSLKTGYLHVEIHSDVMQGFIILYGIIEDIEGIEQRKAAARLGIEFKPNEAYLFIAETLQNAIKRGQPWAISRGYGGFDALDKFCVVGYSIEGREQERNGKNAYREHMIPCDMMNREGIRMFGAGATVEEVAAMFERNNKILLISDSEQETLDYKMGLQCVMPEGWKFGDDVFARIRTACIIMEENVI